jgi:signal transduction histidine kinase
MLDDNNRARVELENKLEELKQTQSMLVQSEKLASLGRLVSDMAHEVNNPLMIISGNAQLSLLDGSLSDDLKNNLNIIHEECNRAKSIIQRLLAFSRSSKGEQKSLDLNKSIEAVVALFQHQFNLSNFKLSLQLSSDLPPIIADEKQFQEVIMNFINNAREAMPGGGEIIIKTFLDGAYLKTEVKDSGVGMDQKTLARVFEPFFTTKEKGTGLGLSVCYGIVKAMNGKIDFDSRPHKGTTVSVCFPAARGGTP